MGNITALQEMSNKPNDNACDISAKVWSFVDEISKGNIEHDLLIAHGLSEVSVNAIKTAGYIGVKAYRNKIFRHLMDSIGYYETLQSGMGNNALNINEIEKRLYKPESWNGFKRKQMVQYPLMKGVAQSIDYINSLLNKESVCSGITDFIPDGTKINKVQSGYELSFKMAYDNSKSDLFYEKYENTPFMIDNQFFCIQKRGCHISKWTRYNTCDDDISICLSHINTQSVYPEKHYYQRYVTEVSNWSNIVHEIAIGLVCIDGIDSYGTMLDIDNNKFALYFFNYVGKNYMIIDSYDKVTEMEMRDFAFSISVTIGLLCGEISLGEYWIVSSDDLDSRNPIGLFYSSLIPSIRSDYSIFTSNVYSILIPAAKLIDQQNGEKRALSIIKTFNLGRAIEPISILVFQRLIENFTKYESLQRGIYILLSGSHLSLELQPAAFAIALEAISNVSKHIFNDTSNIIVPKDVWKKIQPRFTELAKSLNNNGTLSDEQCDNMCKKINSMNNGFNSDKLAALLIHFNYPLTEDDKMALKLRNTLLHGDINIKKMSGEDFDKLFSLSLRLHKLCCSIPLLMAGYKGYIINNCNLYGYEKYRSFIKLR